ncbi:MAG: hypothetical protein NVS2B16_23240 [Chloroflexota bacterium]
MFCTVLPPAVAWVPIAGDVDAPAIEGAVTPAEAGVFPVARCTVVPGSDVVEPLLGIDDDTAADDTPAFSAPVAGDSGVMGPCTETDAGADPIAPLT